MQFKLAQNIFQSSRIGRRLEIFDNRWLNALVPQQLQGLPGFETTGIMVDGNGHGYLFYSVGTESSKAAFQLTPQTG
jgi:hypothetical protein